MQSRIVVFIAMAVVLIAASSCTGLRRINEFGKQSSLARAISRIEGRIETEGPLQGVLVVILGRLIEGIEGEEKLVGVDSYVRVNSGSYVFGVAAGRYQVGAYEDRNRNGLLDPDERAVRVSDSEILEVGPGEHARLDIHLALGATLQEVTEPLDVLAIIERTPEEQRQFSLWAFSAQGRICKDLGDAKFGPEAGSRELWKPMDFLNDELAGIYFLEAYDPERVPVLFVHGLAGYPQEFSTLIEGLDREHFQAWFYFYPSGFALDGISDHLEGLLKRVQVNTHFNRLAIVAHSMGGLVSRGAVLKYKADTKRDDIRLFISISTPWSGEVSASHIASTPIELPHSLGDMDPKSDYLRWIFYEDEQRERLKMLPKKVDYHMIMSFRMTSSKKVASDGKVTLASQARIEAQEEALTIRAWDYDHAGILHSPEVVERMNLLLNSRFY